MKSWRQTRIPLANQLKTSSKISKFKRYSEMLHIRMNLAYSIERLRVLRVIRRATRIWGKLKARQCASRSRTKYILHLRFITAKKSSFLIKTKTGIFRTISIKKKMKRKKRNENFKFYFDLNISNWNFRATCTEIGIL